MVFKSDYELGQSCFTVGDAVSFCEKNDESFLLSADQSFFNVPELFQGCRKSDITPVIGLDVAISGVSIHAICRNEKGFRHLSKKDSKDLQWRDLDDPNLLLILHDADSKEQGVAFLKAFPSAMVGVYDFLDTELKRKSDFLYALSQEYGNKAVFYHVATHLNKEDNQKVAYLHAIQEKKLAQDVALPVDNFFAKPTSLLVPSADSSYPDALSFDIVFEQCVDDYSFGKKPTPPHFPFTDEESHTLNLPSSTNEKDLFVYLCKKGLDDYLLTLKEKDKLGSQKEKEYRDRLDFEMNVIKDMGFSGYMLIVWDFVKKAHELNIPVGAGRGSAAGSLVAFSLDITDIDPLPNGLLFERFLNPERVSMPDIDMDFCQARRPEILDYVANKYGKGRMSQIVTFGTLAAKGAIRDVARILNYPLSKADKLAKTIPFKANSLKEAMELDESAIKKVLRGDAHGQRVFETAMLLEGSKRNIGVHPAGVILSDENISMRSPSIVINGTRVIQCQGEDAEFYDLIKFDFLGLKTLTVIDEALKMAKGNGKSLPELEDIPFDDEKVYVNIAKGETVGIFQIESDGMQELCRDTQPKKFEDIIPINALYRPGTLNSGMKDIYVKRAKGEDSQRFFPSQYDDVLDPILSPTHGVIVYQEQVMKIVQKVGGFSLAESDIIRRAMGKKNIEYMQQKANEFALGAEKKGFDKESAVELFKLIEEFAGYGFNKSHSAAYGVLTYQTAYLKTHCPAEYMASLLNHQGDKEKIAKYVEESKKLGIKIEKPDINSSLEHFESVDGNSIVFSLSSIKGVGSMAEQIIRARNGEKIGEDKSPTSLFSFEDEESYIKPKKGFDSFDDFLERSKCTKRAVDALILAGCFDALHPNRKSLLQRLPNANNIDDFTVTEKIEKEIASLGYCLSDPFVKSRSHIDAFDIPLLTHLKEGDNNILAIIQEPKKKVSAKGNKYASFSAFYDGQSKNILAFKDSISLLDNKDINRPYILSVFKKGDALFLSDILSFTMSNLKKSFHLKNEGGGKGISSSPAR